MADVKISQLPAATTPVDGTEVLPIVQSATTKQVSIANLTAGRAMSASSLTLTNPLAVTSGGTGISTAAQGSLLSATGADTFSATRTPTLGLAGTAAGTLGLSGSTSGVVTLATAAAAGTWTFTLPTSGGSNGWILTTNGSGVSTWTNPTALGVDLDVGTTAITGGTTGRVLYNNAGVLGEYAITGTGSVVLGTSPTFTTSAIFPAGTVGAPGITTTGDTNTGIYFPAADTIGFVEGGVESMRLDASGNLGLGVTPSAWSALRGFDISTAGAVFGFTSQVGLANNAYFDGSNFKYKNTGSAAYFRALGDAFQWQTAPSGTAGNTISFTQAMTLDASGNLGVGTTSPAAGVRLDVQAASGIMELTSSTGTNTSQFRVKNTGGTFFVALDNFNGASFGSGGYGAVLWHSGNYPMLFATNGTERARITGGGEVYIAGTADQGAYNLQCNGTGVWGAGAYVNGSDERLKEDIENIQPCLHVVKSLRPVTFKYKADYSKDTSIQPGFIAQDLQVALGEQVYVKGVVSSGPTYLNVAYQSMIPVLTKAIQELAAEVATLKEQLNG